MALRFDGSTDFVNLGNPAAISTLTAITYSCWINVSSLANAYSAIVAKGASKPFQVFIESNGKLGIYLNGTGLVFYDPGTIVLSIGKWYHIGVTYDATAGLVGYVNGSVDATAAANGNLDISAVNNFLFAEDIGFVGTRNFGGSIAAAAIYSVALSASNISALASGLSPLAVAAAKLVGYWPFQGAQGSLDRGPNGLFGTLNGTTADNDPPFLIPYQRQVFASAYSNEGEWPVTFLPSATGTITLGDRVLDYGLATLDTECDKIYVCAAMPTDYADATSGANSLGVKDFGSGNAFNAPEDAS